MTAAREQQWQLSGCITASDLIKPGYPCPDVDLNERSLSKQTLNLSGQIFSTQCAKCGWAQNILSFPAEVGFSLEIVISFISNPDGNRADFVAGIAGKEDQSSLFYTTAQAKLESLKIYLNSF